jgi:hypothetical protein
MQVGQETEPTAFHVVLHFKEKPFYFSTYVLALIEKYAIEVAQAKLRDHASTLDVESVKPRYATVSDGTSERYFVNRAGEWFELEVRRSPQALRKAGEDVNAPDARERTSASAKG